MKKSLLMLSLVLLLGVCMVGCDSVKKDVYKEEEICKARSFEHLREENLEGVDYIFTDTIVLDEDGTGKIQMQDVLSLTYDEENITLENGQVCSYKIEEDVLTLNYDGTVLEFVQSK